jgi:guanylate kinase
MEIDQTILDTMRQYQPSLDRLTPLKQVPLLFLVGVSGAGKNAVGTALRVNHPGEYHEFVTHTTRAPRKNHGVMEQDGVDYHFVDLAKAKEMLADHGFIEANYFSGNIYGTSIAEIEAAKQEGRIAIGDIDVNGVANFVRLGLNVRPVFILPPDYEVWQKRLMTRYEGHGIDQQDWRNRMQTARSEIMHALATDYFYFVLNDDLPTTVKTIDAVAHGDEPERRSELAVLAAKDILNGINDALA